MRKPEQRLWVAMRDARPRNWKLWRVENIMVAGWPDVHGLCNGRVALIELKVVTAPQRETSWLLKPSDYEKGQLPFHRAYNANGGVSFTVIRDDHYRLYVIRGAAPLRFGEAYQYHRCWAWKIVFEFMEAQL